MLWGCGAVWNPCMRFSPTRSRASAKDIQERGGRNHLVSLQFPGCCYSSSSLSFGENTDGEHVALDFLESRKMFKVPNYCLAFRVRKFPVMEGIVRKDRSVFSLTIQIIEMAEELFFRSVNQCLLFHGSEQIRTWENISSLRWLFSKVHVLSRIEASRAGSWRNRWNGVACDISLGKEVLSYFKFVRKE